VRLGRDIDVGFRDIRGPELALNGLLSFAGTGAAGGNTGALEQPPRIAQVARA
jgi:hypothetical protein